VLGGFLVAAVVATAANAIERGTLALFLIGAFVWLLIEVGSWYERRSGSGGSGTTEDQAGAPD